MSAPDPARLNALRARIDELDETLHRALVERSGIIDEVIVAKGSRASEGAVFRPGREADMMRRLCSRHSGSLPLRDVEHIWHVVIAAHTALQSAFEVFVDVSGDPLPSWDAARFLVGFAVPVEPCGSPELVIEAMGESGTALGLVPCANPSDWWSRLGGEGPRIMARLPAIEGASAIVPHWVLSPVLSDPVPFDVPLTRVRVPEDADAEGADIVAAHDAAEGTQHLLVAGEVTQALRAASLDTADCGGYHHPAPAAAR